MGDVSLVFLVLGRGGRGIGGRGSMVKWEIGRDWRDWANVEVGGRGDDPATGKQMGYIAVMAQKAGEAKPAEGMGKTEASQKIGKLKGKTGM